MAYQGNVPAEAYTTTVKDTFNGNGSTTAFTLSLPTVTNDIRVVVENVVQEPTAAYSVSGTTLTFTAAPPSGTGNVYVVHLGPAVQTVEPPSTIAGATTFASTVSAQSDLLFPDNSKAIFGAGSDLQIYHNGTNSIISDEGAGALVVQSNGSGIYLNNGVSENMLTAVIDGAVTLYHDNAAKLATTATGIDVTGTVVADGLTVDGTGGQITTDNNGFITSKQSLDVATAGGRFIGKSNRGELGHMAIEQTANGADGGYIRFDTSPSGSTSPTERMRIDSSGNLLVGTTNSGSGGTAAKQRIIGAANNNLYLGSTSSGGYRIVSDSLSDGGTFYHINFLENGTNRGSIRSNGSSTTYNTSSDYRLKTDAQPMTGASARVLALKPVNFEWISSGDRVDGFLAHEAQEIVPEAVHGTKDAMRDEEYEVTAAVLDADGMVVTEAVMGTRSVPDMQGIDQSKLVPLLTAALQEALNKIDAMETRLSALEGN